MTQLSYALPTMHPELGSKVLLQLSPKGLPMHVLPNSPDLSGDVQALAAWIAEKKDVLDQLLLQFGALRFKGFGIKDTAAFALATRAYESSSFGYVGGGAPRESIQGKVFEATKVDRQHGIRVHQEMSYLPTFPFRLAFFCQVAADSGGATTICDVRKVEPFIPPVMRDKVEKHGVSYNRNFRDGTIPVDGWSPIISLVHRSWQDAFSSSTREGVETHLKSMGLEYEWLSDGSVQTRYTCSGFTQHPMDGRSYWFNQINQWNITRPDAVWPVMSAHYGPDKPWYAKTTYGNGDELGEADLYNLRAIHNLVTVDDEWEPGEILLLDNVICCHGRSPYAGTRDVQVQLLGSGYQ